MTIDSVTSLHPMYWSLSAAGARIKLLSAHAQPTASLLSYSALKESSRISTICAVPSGTLSAALSLQQFHSITSTVANAVNNLHVVRPPIVASLSTLCTTPQSRRQVHDVLGAAESVPPISDSEVTRGPMTRPATLSSSATLSSNSTDFSNSSSNNTTRQAWRSASRGSVC